MPARSGQQYLDTINQLNSSIWYDGEEISGKVWEHKAYSGVMNSISKLYDFQLKDEKLDYMTYVSPTTKDRVGVSYLEPRSKEDLEKRRLMIQEWARLSGGLLGRSPDYMNTALTAFASAADVLSKQDLQYSTNLVSVYENAREKDLSLTHTFIHPQVNRSRIYYENENEIITAQPIKKTGDGLIIKGARLLATQGGITDEILVLPSSAAAYNRDLAYGFCLPSNTPGIKFMCRESFRYSDSTFNHPLGSRFEEMDAIVVFDNVLVPWERVFFHDNPEIAHSLYSDSGFFPLVTHQVLSRRIIKTEFVLGVVQLITETINISEYQHIQDKISEIIIGLESLKALLLASELNGKPNKWGTMLPDNQSLKAATCLFPRIYPRFMEILQLTGASGLISIPTENDFSSCVKDDLRKYLQATNADAEDRVKIFRLGWDLCMSAFGSRSTLYERFFFGDPVKLSSGLYQTYDFSPYTDRVRNFLSTD